MAQWRLFKHLHTFWDVIRTETMLSWSRPRFAVLFSSILIATAAHAWTTNDWNDVLVEFYSKITKGENQVNISSEFLQLFADDSEGLPPGTPPVGGEGKPVFGNARMGNLSILRTENRFKERHLIDHQYIAMVELLYTSGDVAVVRGADYIDFVGGRRRKLNSLDLVVRDEDGVKLKLYIYNFV